MKLVGGICLMATVLAVMCERGGDGQPVAECEKLQQALAARAGRKVGKGPTPLAMMPTTEQEKRELRALCGASTARVRQACC